MEKFNQQSLNARARYQEALKLKDMKCLRFGKFITLIPNYNLEKCARENPILQKYATTVTFRESLRCMFSKLWDEERERMISFREFRRMEKLGLV